MVRTLMAGFVVAGFLCWGRADYGFVFFRGDGEDHGVFLARSADGYHWTEQADGPILKGAVGGGLTRDPSALRGADGFYHMVWTTAWNTNGFGLAHSPDLRTWSRQEFVPVMADFADVKNVWAPELFYDKATEQYVVIWASTVGEADRGNRQWCATTRDFTSWSKARVLFDSGFDVIDAFPLRLGDRPLPVVKDERQDRKCLFVVNLKGPGMLSKCERLDEPFTRMSEGWVEGPTALALPDGTWVIYFDEYRSRRYGAVTTRDFKTFALCRDFSLPKGIRHGTAFPLLRGIGPTPECSRR